MIIEIKDIPQGKKIKHLSVDIDFTDSSENDFVNEFKPTVKTVQEKTSEIQKVSQVSQVSQFMNSEVSEPKQETQKNDFLPEVNISNREEKAIPEEMTNAEF